ncbi:hypothetical protein WEN_00800 [Mycoplasma wenyonii str. Massachusetts]|uniref:Uncharacterized protein n=1 Tax=Mycoplasma wenyonii (strain Massachusetts) TaxID=1197325 RepID=I6Z5W8_MYCWM|nr:hypothetical protein [Mycoplasma wenyonii]AFN64963.1 hypothetical protein WEN_00800 [Mycoplasma wenyonii str. Massachusetts]
MLGTKILLTSVISGVSGLVGYTSLSIPNWDPKNVWRIKSNNKFYLSLCSYRGEKSGNWVASDLWIYLTIKDKVTDNIDTNTKLELWGEGYHWRGDGAKVTQPPTWRAESLQELVRGSFGTQGRFNWINDDGIDGEGRVTRLGEVGGGEENETFGSYIRCPDKLFQFSGSGRKEKGLNEFKFSLDNCKDGSERKGTKECSIKVELTKGSSPSEQLEWKEFIPRVIID